ncbi:MULTISPECIES: type II toxin-antitoxin system RelE family toxin [Methanoculleus]|uniref:Plasmid stabilization system n=2 Tax=Methanoculleus TaxID=45989 RepID=A3CVK1_METMJ|nr:MULTISPECIES: type II toxin-antitoxin system RelE/ParE family toxin [Methanoculleus]ABN57401.1 plasmid stabilization system [Methanoculleus marisnigri JR1]UYU18808.1 type II toxin-antitoxin system RelE/ParE family toxin [Methanoculleus submarinus]
MYALIYSPGAQKDVAGLPRDMAVRIHTSLKKIKADLYNHVRKLEGSFAVPLYSYRIGQYRCILTIEDNKLVIFVVEIGYKNISRKY